MLHGLGHMPRPVVGPQAASGKYDILTALLVLAAQGNPVDARLALRLSLLITARYNWRAGTFSVAQKEMARLWGVTERTAKREVAALRSRGWITVAIPAARGRVATHRIEFDTLLRVSMPLWPAVGPDYLARMTAAPEPEEQASNVVKLPDRSLADPDPDGTGWGRAAEMLRAQDPSVFDAWFAALRAVDVSSGVLTLMAPSRFVADYVKTHFLMRILAAMAACDASIRDVNVVHG